MTGFQNAETPVLKVEKGCIPARPVNAPFHSHGGLFEDNSVALNLIQKKRPTHKLALVLVISSCSAPLGMRSVLYQKGQSRNCSTLPYLELPPHFYEWASLR